MKKIYGIYSSSTEARSIVDKLLEDGYSKDDIKVVSNRALGINRNEEIEDNDKGLWEKIKDAFTFDEYDDNYWDRELDDSERTLVEGYRLNLNSGEILVLVEERDDLDEAKAREEVPNWQRVEVREDHDENFQREHLSDYYEDKNNTEFPRKESKISSKIDESTMRNMEKDPLKNRNINDDGLRKDDLKDIDRNRQEGDGLSRDNIESDRFRPDGLDLSNIDEDSLNRDEGFNKDDRREIEKRPNNDIDKNRRL